MFPVIKCPSSLLFFALDKADPGEMVEIMKHLSFCDEVKMKFFKKVVREIYLSMPHYKIVTYRRTGEVVYGLISVFEDQNHRCISECRSKFFWHIEMIKMVLTPSDYEIFLFVMDQFCKYGLSLHIFGTLRYFTLERLIPLVTVKPRMHMDGKIYQDDCDDGTMYSCFGVKGCHTQYLEHHWHCRLENVFERQVGIFKREGCPSGYLCFDEVFDENEGERRTLQAKEFMSNLSRYLPSEQRDNFLLHAL